MKITYASQEDLKNLISFFENHIKKADFSEYYYEYFCPYGLKAAIKRWQVIILKLDDNIMWAIRFYPRKKENHVSLYQFALSEQVRWKGILEKMLKFTWYSYFWFKATTDLELNSYFQKQKWELSKIEERFNYWKIKI